jgi:hypothetical protein
LLINTSIHLVMPALCDQCVAQRDEGVDDDANRGALEYNASACRAVASAARASPSAL